MASLRRVRQFESLVQKQREVYEAALDRVGHAQWAAYYAIRPPKMLFAIRVARKPLRKRGTMNKRPDKPLTRRNEPSGKPIVNCSDWRPYCSHSGQGTFHEIAIAICIYWLLM